MDRPIYLDYCATTPVDARVLAAMQPFFCLQFGNPSSTHTFGLDAREALDLARSRVAALIGSRPSEVVFTGGGSESDNLAIAGVAFNRLGDRPHIVSTMIEHPAVLNTLQYLQRRFGVDVTLISVDSHGRVTAEQVREALRPETVLVSVMHANNEVGTLQPIADIGRVTRDAGILFHVDAAQSAGKVPIRVDEMSVDLLTLAGHKLYAPKGIGALYVRSGTQLDPVIHGSSQEHGLRAGTENVASSVGLGVAADLASQEMDCEESRLTSMRDRLFHLLQSGIPDLELNGHPLERLPNVLNVSFPGVDGWAVLGCAPFVAASTGSACHSDLDAPSPVLTAMGLSRRRTFGAVRLSLGRLTTETDIEQAAAYLLEAAMTARQYASA
jgi:cysteine desulfurase